MTLSPVEAVRLQSAQTLSVHPALAPLSRVELCLFYLKCVVCIVTDIRDNRPFPGEGKESSPAYAAESANAVFLHSVKRSDAEGAPSSPTLRRALLFSRKKRLVAISDNPDARCRLLGALRVRCGGRSSSLSPFFLLSEARLSRQHFPGTPRASQSGRQTWAANHCSRCRRRSGPSQSKRRFGVRETLSRDPRRWEAKSDARWFVVFVRGCRQLRADLLRVMELDM